MEEYIDSYSVRNAKRSSFSSDWRDMTQDEILSYGKEWRTPKIVSMWVNKRD